MVTEYRTDARRHRIAEQKFKSCIEKYAQDSDENAEKTRVIQFDFHFPVPV
jgi:hypothetical protein